jgi:hypothetical protein
MQLHNKEQHNTHEIDAPMAIAVKFLDRFSLLASSCNINNEEKSTLLTPVFFV